MLAQAKGEIALWDLRLFQYQYEGATGKVDPVLLQCVQQNNERLQSETEKVLSKYKEKALYEDNSTINEIIQRCCGVFILRGYSRVDGTEL